MEYTFKKYFTFSADEIKSLIITILIIGFIFSFKEWGADKFDLMSGLKNFINSALIVGLAFLVHEGSHRYFALLVGLKPEYKAWVFGLVLALIITFLSRGELIFLAPGGIIIHHLAGLRLGRYRYGMQMRTFGWIAAAGPLANIVLAVFFKLMLLLPLNPVLINKAIYINVWLAVFNMLPIPPLDGSKMFYSSRATYALLMGFIIAIAVLLSYVSITLSLILSAIIAIIVLIIYWAVFEKPV